MKITIDTVFEPGWYQVHSSAYPRKYSECPYCGSKNIEDKGAMTTLVGYSGGPMDDGNHFTQERTCGHCFKKWYREWVPRNRSVWLADPDGVILAGEPTCCTSRYRRQK